jgi:opacity protein-like surface antigen
MKKGFLAAGLALGLGFAAPALAAEAQNIELQDFLAAPDQPGLRVEGGLGAGTVTGGSAGLLGRGPVWGVQVGTQATRGIGFEAGYVGSRFPFQQEADVADGSALFRHGLSGMAKVYVPVEMMLRPYAGIGLGISHLNPGTGAEDRFNNDFVTEVPLAGGVEFNTQGGLIAGARLGYSAVFGTSFADEAVEGSPGAGFLTGTLMVGGRF